MLRLIRILRGRRSEGEDGIALAVVIGMAAVLMVLTMTALTYSVGTTTKASADSNQDAAVAAAYAGVSDYQSRLTNDNTYVKYGDPAAPFSAQTGSSTLVLPTPLADGSPANPAFGWGASGTWAPVPGATGNTAFRYEVDNSQYTNDGVIRILATGRSGTETRTVLANLHQKGFLDYLYFTNYEVQDPAITGDSQSKCTQYYPTRVDANCGGAIQFSKSEEINGPVDSNDAMLICGGTFDGPVSTNYTPKNNGTQYYRTDGCNPLVTPTFNSGPPAHGPALLPPPTNQAMAQETRGDLTDSTVPRPGCLYTGPTSIVFNGDGTMTVRSPWTKYTNTGIDSSGKPYGITNANCGDANASGLWSAAGQKIPVPKQNLIFVQSVPTTSAKAPSNDPNAWATGTFPSVSGYLPCPGNQATDGNDLGYPFSSTTTSGSTTTTITETLPSTSSGEYDCLAGDAFVQGTLKGQVTVATDHYVWITGDLKYSDPSSDVLGLVGQNAVWVWNPYGTVTTATTGPCNCHSGGTTTSTKTTSESLLPTDIPGHPDSTYVDPSTQKSATGRLIQAAIMSVQHTFQVQNYEEGSGRGSLSVVGAIAQQYRGTVGTVSSNGGVATGYAKNYSYDKRFINIAPPKFLQAVSTTYGISQIADVPAAFSSNGASK